MKDLVTKPDEQAEEGFRQTTTPRLSQPSNSRTTETRRNHTVERKACAARTRKRRWTSEQKAMCGDKRPERGRGPEVAGVKRRKQQCGSERVARRSTRTFNKASRLGIFASSDWTRRWTCLVRGMHKHGKEHKNPTETGSTRHVDRSISASVSASRSVH